MGYSANEEEEEEDYVEFEDFCRCNHFLVLQIVILVYDITNIPSFESLDEWLDTIRKIISSQEPHPFIAVVANKCKY